MKIRVPNIKLIEALNSVLKVVPDKSSVTIATSTFMSVSFENGGELRVVGCDIYYGVDARIDQIYIIETEGPSSFAINGQKLLALLKTKPLGLDVVLSSSKRGLSVGFYANAGSLQYHFDSANASEYPIAFFDTRGYFPIMKWENKNDFSGYINSLKQAMPFVSKDELKFAMCGVYHDYIYGNPRIVATDAHALYSERCPYLSECNSFILEKKLASIAISLLSDAESVSFQKKNGDGKHVAGERVFFEAKGIRIWGPVVNAIYPKYQNVIPPKKDTIEIDREILIEAIERASIFCEKDGPQIRMDLDPGAGCLWLYPNPVKEGVGEKISFTPESIFEKMTIAMNPAYFLIVLKSMYGEKIFIDFDGPCRGIKVWPHFDAKKNERYAILMPVMLNTV